MPVIKLQNPLDQPAGKNRLLDDLHEDLGNPEYKSLKIIVAFAKLSPLRKLEKHLDEWVARGNTLETIIGIDQNGTSYEGLEFALRKFDKVGVVHGKSSFNSTFHPKIYFFEGDRYSKVFIGSNNLTVGGTETNSESYICIEMSLPEDEDLLDQVNNMWTESLRMSKLLDEQILSSLKESGLVLEEKVLRTVRIKTQIAIAETDKKPDLAPTFPKLKMTQASRLPTKTPEEMIAKEWRTYGKYLEENTKSNVNLYWKVSNKNNRLDQHLWTLDYLIKNGAEQSNPATNDALIRAISREVYAEHTMEGNRALLFSKLTGFLRKTTGSFEVSDAYRALSYPDTNETEKNHNATIITNQLEKFYFWNNILGETNRHLGRGGKTRAKELFHVYPIIFLYQLIISLKNKGYSYASLSKFEIETFAVLARDHSELETVAQRISSFRENERPDELEEYLKNHSKELDTRFYRILMYSKYFSFSDDLVALKQEYLDEVEEKVKSFEQLIATGKLIEFVSDNVEDYRKLLYSPLDIISYHQSNL